MIVPVANITRLMLADLRMHIIQCRCGRLALVGVENKRCRHCNPNARTLSKRKIGYKSRVVTPLPDDYVYCGTHRRGERYRFSCPNTE